ncbi:CHAT domain-containing protein [Aerosakkonemataceae cyanobacterium BLCC-F50]|uniref:CHAT domain-containing protein n=1 Tax=Floridaenema flaviceps BLCC-F50 TaxID=3153642 RepID=A0ABV4XJP0_9CYAN
MLVNLAKWEPALALIPTIENNLSELPATRPSIYAKINLAESLLRIEHLQANKPGLGDGNGQKIAQLLVTAIQEAQKIQDPRAEAYSLYKLGKVYQIKNQLNDAKNLNKQSLQIAQGIKADDIIARSAGQLGSILKQQGEVKEAIAAYEIAFNNLQSLRSDLVGINPELQFSFKEGIEPLYRDLVSLLLTPIQGEVSQANLKQARQVMEALQIAELDNFFQDACLDSHPVSLDQIDVKAAVIYPIILPDRLEVILAIPNQPLRHYTTQLTQQQVETTLKQFYSSLSPGYPNDERLQLAQQIYNWLIAPATSNLENNQIKTLVFVPDGFLRNLPMAAVHNGTKYLIEDYNLSLSPGLQLFPQGLNQKKLTLLAAGLTEARQGFQPLPGVYAEIEEITSEIKAEVLLNQKFTLDSFRNTINSQAFPIIHLATHGQFSSNPEETFLLTWSDRISISEFDLLFQRRRLGLLEPIELLVMSACQTAAGDNRATLGLAGFALRSGAKSTIASLWSVSDESTSNLMQELYQQLSTGKVNKAEALRQAQLKLMANPLYKHPYFWSAFVLVGNWL